jgi:hypothetical protein
MESTITSYECFQCKGKFELDPDELAVFNRSGRIPTYCKAHQATLMNRHSNATRRHSFGRFRSRNKLRPHHRQSHEPTPVKEFPIDHDHHDAGRDDDIEPIPCKTCSNFIDIDLIRKHKMRNRPPPSYCSVCWSRKKHDDHRRVSLASPLLL